MNLLSPSTLSNLIDFIIKIPLKKIQHSRLSRLIEKLEKCRNRNKMVDERNEDDENGHSDDNNEYIISDRTDKLLSILYEHLDNDLLLIVVKDNNSDYNSDYSLFDIIDVLVSKNYDNRIMLPPPRDIKQLVLQAEIGVKSTCLLILEYMHLVWKLYNNEEINDITNLLLNPDLETDINSNNNEIDASLDIFYKSIAPIIKKVETKTKVNFNTPRSLRKKKDDPPYHGILVNSNTNSNIMDKTVNYIQPMSPNSTTVSSRQKIINLKPESKINTSVKLQVMNLSSTKSLKEIISNSKSKVNLMNEYDIDTLTSAKLLSTDNSSTKKSPKHKSKFRASAKKVLEDSSSELVFLPNKIKNNIPKSHVSAAPLRTSILLPHRSIDLIQSYFDLFDWLNLVGINFDFALLANDDRFNIGAIIESFKSGILLAKLYEILTHIKIAIIEKPSGYLSNITRVLTELRYNPKVSIRFLHSATDILAGKESVIIGLLMDIKIAYEKHINYALNLKIKSQKKKLSKSKSFISLEDNSDDSNQQDDLNNISSLYKNDASIVFNYPSIYEIECHNFIINWSNLRFINHNLFKFSDICNINHKILVQICSLSFGSPLIYGNFLNDFIDNSFNFKSLLLNTLQDVSIINNSFLNGTLLLNLAAKLVKRLKQLFLILKRVQKSSYLNWLRDNNSLKQYNELHSVLNKPSNSNVTIPESLIKLLSSQFSEFALIAKFKCFQKFIFSSKIRNKLSIDFPEPAKTYNECKRNNIFAITVFQILGAFETELSLDQIELKVNDLMISKNDMTQLYLEIMENIPSLNIDSILMLLNNNDIYSSFSLSYNPFNEYDEHDENVKNTNFQNYIDIHTEDFIEMVEGTALIWVNSWLLIRFKHSLLFNEQIENLSSSLIQFRSTTELIFSLQSGFLLADLIRDVILFLYPDTELLNAFGLSTNAVTPSICIHNLTIVCNAIKKYLIDMPNTHLWEPERIFLLDRNYIFGLLYDLLRCFEKLPPKINSFPFNKKQSGQDLKFINWFYENISMKSKYALENEIILLEMNARSESLEEIEEKRINIIENFNTKNLADKLPEITLNSSNPISSSCIRQNDLSFVSLLNSASRDDIYPSFHVWKEPLDSPIRALPSEITRKLEYSDLLISEKYFNSSPIQYKRFIQTT